MARDAPRGKGGGGNVTVCLPLPFVSLPIFGFPEKKFLVSSSRVPGSSVQLKDSFVTARGGAGVYPMRIVHHICAVDKSKKYTLYKMQVWPGSSGHIMFTLGRGYLFSTELYSSVSLNSIT